MHKTLSIIPFLLVHESLVLAPSILKNDRKAFDEALQKIESCFMSRSDGSDVMPCSSHNDDRQIEEWLSEKYSGNQTVLHLCAGNLSPSADNGLLYMWIKITSCQY